jgi:hypothetical protein
VSRYRAPAGAPQAFLAAIPQSGNGCLTWPYGKSGSGYACINGNTTILVSRLICERAHGPAPTPAHQAAHSCGMGANACVAPWHLSWKTPVENGRDQYFHGTRIMGVRHPMAKLTEAAVFRIRRLVAQGMTVRAVAAEEGTSFANVSRIARRETWGHLP